MSKAGTKKPRKCKVMPTAEELRGRVNLSIEEARILSGYSRHLVLAKVTNGDWRWYWEGARRRIITSSITEYMDSKARKAVGE